MYSLKLLYCTTETTSEMRRPLYSGHYWDRLLDKDHPWNNNLELNTWKGIEPQTFQLTAQDPTHDLIVTLGLQFLQLQYHTVYTMQYNYKYIIKIG